MADIRPKDLPPAATVLNSAALIVDNGATVDKATPLQIVDAGAPLASQAEAEAGTNNTRRVSPLRVSQAIDIRGYDGAISGKEPIIVAGTATQYWRGDKTWQTLNKAAVGLPNVDNTSDANKPISSATQTALNLKAPIASPAFTGTVTGITQAMVGLGNVDNTSDANKPISSATQTALNLKAPIASPAFTGTVTGITQAMVGLGNVDNTSDANKPISTATATALSGKEPTLAAGTITQYYRGDKSWQTLDTGAVSGLGTAAVRNIGTSGATVPLLNTVNTWAANQTLSAIGLGATTRALVVDVDNGAMASVFLRTGGLDRWILTKNNTSETGAETGSDFAIVRCTDTGVANGSAIAISRATGAVTLSSPLAPASGGTGGNISASSGSSLVGFLQAGTGATARTTQDKARDFVSVKDFGAVGNGVTNDNAAMVAAQTYSSSVYWPEGTYVLSAVPDITKSWGPGICLVGGNRVYLRPTSEPASEILADIFGLVKNGTTSDSAALQRAIDFAQSLQLRILFPPNAQIYLGTGLTFKQGRAATGDPFVYSVDVDLNGCTFYPAPGVRAFDIVPRCLLADASSNRGSGDFRFVGRDAVIDGSKGDASSRAVRIGATGYFFSPFTFGVFEDLLIHLFSQTTDVLEVVEARHFNPENIVVRAGICRQKANAPGSFSGDQTWKSCEFTGTGGNECLTLVANNGTGSGASAVVRGIRFSQCVTYGPNAAVTAGVRGDTGDIWFDSHQFEGPYDASVGGRGLDIYATGVNSRVFGVFLNSPYFAGMKGPAVYARSVSGGDVRAIHINSPDCAAFTVSAATAIDANCNAIFAFSGVVGFNVNNASINSIVGDTNTIVANIQSSLNFSVNGFNGANFTGISAGTVAGGTSDRGSMTGIVLPITSANIAINTGSGTQFVIANNLKVT